MFIKISCCNKWLFLLPIFLFKSAGATVEDELSVVVLFGDSITIGYNLEENFTTRYGFGRTAAQIPGSKPTVEMNAILNNEDEPRTSVVVNWGIGGSNTVSGVNRMASSLQTTKNQVSGKKYYVLILYGTNDIANQSITSSDTAFNIQLMINTVRAQGANFVPIVANLTPRDDRNVLPYNAKIVPAVQSANAPLVRLYEAFINYPGGFTKLLGQETSALTGKLIRLHPNATGYRVIAQTWFNQSLKNLIEPDPLPSVVAPILLLLLGDEPVL